MVQTNCLFSAVCVAGYSSSKNEILELSLPPKLCADENKVTNIKTFQTLTFIIVNTMSKCHFNPLAQYVCVVFRVFVLSGTLKLSTVASQTVLSAASNMSRVPGEFMRTTYFTVI